MTKQIIIALMSQMLLALADGRITGEEVAKMLEFVAQMCGFTKGDFHEVFVEQDGDLHLILKKSALDKLAIDL